MTGFRLAFGGAQQLYHQMPDLTVTPAQVLDKINAVEKRVEFA